MTAYPETVVSHHFNPFQLIFQTDFLFSWLQDMQGGWWRSTSLFSPSPNGLHKVLFLSESWLERWVHCSPDGLSANYWIWYQTEDLQLYQSFTSLQQRYSILIWIFTPKILNFCRARKKTIQRSGRIDCSSDAYQKTNPRRTRGHSNKNQTGDEPKTIGPSSPGKYHGFSSWFSG